MRRKRWCSTRSKRRISRPAARGVGPPGVCYDPPHNAALSLYPRPFLSAAAGKPWLEAIEVQDSARPSRLERRITAECYAPNAASRILDGERRIERIVNKLRPDQLHCGPPLAWMEQKEPEVYRAIMAADAESREHFSGHGRALAQGYNNIIMPLANRRDKQTQILWGLTTSSAASAGRRKGCGCRRRRRSRDARAARRGGRRFNVLEPHQPGGCGEGGQEEEEWRDVGAVRIDPSIPYEVRSPRAGARHLHSTTGRVSRAVAFEGLLVSGERFADRLLSTVPAAPGQDRLVNIATDGRDLTATITIRRDGPLLRSSHIEENGLARLTNYGEYLETHPPDHGWRSSRKHRLELLHGVGRWREDCGCHTAAAPAGSRMAGAAAPGARLAARRAEPTLGARGRGRSSPIPGRRGTPTSTCSSTARPRLSTPFWPASRGPALRGATGAGAQADGAAAPRHVMYT